MSVKNIEKMQKVFHISLSDLNWRRIFFGNGDSVVRESSRDSNWNTQNRNILASEILIFRGVCEKWVEEAIFFHVWKKSIWCFLAKFKGSGYTVRQGMVGLDSKIIKWSWEDGSDVGTVKVEVNGYFDINERTFIRQTTMG